MTIIDKVNLHKNDYSPFISQYQTLYKEEFNTDPFESLYVHRDYEIDKTVSIIIPSWNSNETILLTLKTIEISNICKFHNDKLEVVIVDDGSDVCCREVIRDYEFPFLIKIVRQEHQGRAIAINNGILHSIGEIIVFMDSDILLYPYALDELIKRQLIIGDKGIAFGFREDKQKYEIEQNNLEQWLFNQLPCYWLDNRFLFDTCNSWGINMMLETNLLLKRSAKKNIWLCDGHEVVESCWQFYRMVYGFLFSVTRKNFVKVGGFDKSLKGWGWEDSLFVAKCISAGINIIPIPSACAIHIYHQARSQNKWKEAKTNFLLLMEIISRYEYPAYSNIEINIVDIIDIKKKKVESSTGKYQYTKIKEYLKNNKGLYYYQLGRINEAKEILEKNLSQLNIQEYGFYIDCLIRLQCKEILKNTLLKYGSKGLFISFLAAYIIGEKVDEDYNLDDPNFLHCFQYPEEEHKKRADIYFEEEQYYFALRDYFAYYIKSSKIPDKLEKCIEKLRKPENL